MKLETCTVFQRDYADAPICIILSKILESRARSYFIVMTGDGKVVNLTVDYMNSLFDYKMIRML